MLGYRLLGKSGLRVSEICLGTMSFGDQWGFGADGARRGRGGGRARSHLFAGGDGVGALARLRVHPIVGARKVEQIQDTLGSARVRSTGAQLEKLDAVSRTELGFPHAFLRANAVRDLIHSESRTRLQGRVAKY